MNQAPGRGGAERESPSRAADLKKVNGIIRFLNFAALAALALFALAACREVSYVEDAETGAKLAVVETVGADGASTWTTEAGETVPAESVRTRTEFSEGAEETVESVLALGKAQGGAVGAISSALLLAWGLYKSKKVKSTQLTLASVVGGVSDVLAAVREASESGEKLSEADVKALLKAAQEDAGTRDAVDKLLAEQKTTATGLLSKLAAKLRAWLA